MSEIRLAAICTDGDSRALKLFEPGEIGLPSLLISYAYIDAFVKQAHELQRRSWVLDSGAFTAAAGGKHFSVGKYVERVKQLVGDYPDLQEVFALDVIGDWRGTMRNVEQMTRLGVNAIPTVHLGCPLDVVRSIAADYPKLALGGLVGKKKNATYPWIEDVLAAIWPKRLHLFGSLDRNLMRRMPFDSADASSWQSTPLRFRTYASFNRFQFRGPKHADVDVRTEIEFYLKFEAELATRWRHELEPLRKANPNQPILR